MTQQTSTDRLDVDRGVAPTYAPEPRILSLGDCALTLELGRDINPQIQSRVAAVAGALATQANDGGLAGAIEWVPTFRSLTVHFDPDKTDSEALARMLLVLARDGRRGEVAGQRWAIPVCFDDEFATDLEELAATKRLSAAEVVRVMTRTEFTVGMLGFLPGFPYLTGLPPACEMPRLATPRKVVPARSIAVAGRMCAAYPWESPGGWRLLGRTPIRLFDATSISRPALLASGDTVVWHAVDRAEYQEIERACAVGPFDRAGLLASGADL